MSTKYQKPFTIPDDFPPMLKAFTREILRSQPANIYEFGARYFTDLIEKQQSQKARQEQASTSRGSYHAAAEEPAAAPAQRPSSDSRSDKPSSRPSTTPPTGLADIESKLAEMFLSMDPDQTGQIHRDDFETILYDGSWNLTDEQVMQIIGEACTDDSELVEYEQAMPLLVETLQSLIVG